jgi:thymidylate synthase
MEIRAATMKEAWKRAVALILSEGRTLVDDDKRECHELRNLVVVIENPATAAEGVRAMRLAKSWIYPSEEELANIMLNKEAASIYDYLFGQRIFSYRDTFDQVDEYVIPLLQQRPNSRRAVIALLDPVEDLRLGVKNIMGLCLIHFQVVDKRLCVTAVIRTSGFFTGWPANVYQVSKLQEYVARALSLPQGSITTISLSAHLFKENLEDIGEVLGKDVLRDAKRE